MSPGQPRTGSLTSRPTRRFRVVLALQVLWVTLSLLLVVWWGSLLYRQAERISALERQLGITAARGTVETGVSTSMIFWESASFVVLLIVTAVVLHWLYWRDELRRRGLEAFFASITHELRTPLTSIRLQAESLGEDLPADASARKLLGRLLEDTSRLEAQVERTLELARLEGGGALFPTEIPIDPWLTQALARAAGERGDKLRVSTQLEAAGARILADPYALEIIVRNALENAVRHAGREPVEVSVRTSVSPQGVEVRFRDNGKGFSGDASRLGKLFEKGPQSKGSGIGLYLIRGLMAQLGGKADFASPGGFETRLVFHRLGEPA